MESIIMYTTNWCPDCRRAKTFLKERGVSFREVNIEEDESAEAIVVKMNDGKSVVPTFDVGGRYFACRFGAQDRSGIDGPKPLDPSKSGINGGRQGLS